MSYASVAAHNAPPKSQQPHADTALLNTSSPSPGIADERYKVNIVPSDFKTNPQTETSMKEPLTTPSDEELPHEIGKGKKKARHAKDKARAQFEKAEEEGLHFYAVAKEYILRPGVAGGLVGIMNVGLMSWATYSFWTKPELRRDTNLIAATAGSAFALLGLEGYAAESYLQTPKGQAEKRRAKERGSDIYHHTKEVVLRPGVLGGLVGAVNVGILGAIGYFSYVNWDKPTWDRRVVSAVSVGLLGLWGGEGILAEQYIERRK